MSGVHPARYQYREFFILVDALYQGKPIVYCPYIFVDNDAALARGWTQGYPKRIGQVFQTRYYAATGKAGPALAPGSKFAGSLTSSGQRLAEGIVTLREPVIDMSLLKQKPVINLLHCPRLAADKQDQPAVHELVENRSSRRDDRASVDRRGFPDTAGLQRRRTVRPGAHPFQQRHRASMAYVVDDLKTLEKLSK